MKNKLIKELMFEENNFNNIKQQQYNINNINKNNNQNHINNNNNNVNNNNKNNEKDFNYRYSNNNLYFKSEIALWKAVILQALVDLQSNSKKKIANTYRIKALMWFNLKNEDFITVCNYAGLDPKYVYEKSRIVKENNKFLI